MNDGVGYALESMYYELKKRVELIRERIREAKMYLSRIYELLDHVACLPKNVRPSIPRAVIESLMGIGKENILQKIEELKNVYRVLASEAVSILSTELADLARKCSDVELYHESIVRMLDEVAKRRRSLPSVVTKHLKAIVKDPCDVYREILSSVKNLYEIDEEMTRLSAKLSEFLGIDETVIRSAVLKQLESVKSFEELVSVRNELRDLRNLFDEVLMKGLGTLESILRLGDEFSSACRLEAPYSTTLAKRISESLARFVDMMCKRYDILRSSLEGSAGLSELHKFLKRLMDDAEDLIEVVNKHLDSYKNLISRLLNKLGESALSRREVRLEGLQIKTLNIESIRNLCENLTIVDEILTNVLTSRLSEIEKKVLGFVLKLLYESRDFRKDLNSIVKDLNEREFNVFLKLCEKGVINCFVSI